MATEDEVAPVAVAALVVEKGTWQKAGEKRPQPRQRSDWQAKGDSKQQ